MMSRAIVLAAGACLSTACAGLDTGNAEVSTVQLALTTSAAPIVDSGGTSFTVDAARANVRHVDLYLPAGASCAEVPGLVANGGDYSVSCEGDKIRARGPWSVDLLTGQATPALPVVPVVAGTYRRVDVRFESNDDDDIALLVTGNTTIGGASTPYRMGLGFEDEVRFEGASFVAAPDSVAAALLVLDPVTWFGQLPIAQCAADGDLEIVNGVVQVEDGDGACDDIEDLIVAAIGGSGQLEDDDD